MFQKAVRAFVLASVGARAPLQQDAHPDRVLRMHAGVVVELSVRIPAVATEGWWLARTMGAARLAAGPA
eukprot:8374812-Alexandrium_andersonii.AAC.1